jgi:hypothetical protein
MPTPSRSSDHLNLSIEGKQTGMLQIGSTSVLFFNEKPVAVRQHGDSDVFVLDADVSRAATAAINKFTGTGYQIRTAGAEFDFVLSTALMSQLRTLTRSQQDATE